MDGLRGVIHLNRQTWNACAAWFRPAAFATWAVLVVINLSGCVGPWRPSREHVSQPVATTQVSELGRCLRANRLGRWVYERSPMPEREGQPTRIYVRQVGSERLSEGVLENRLFLQINRYLDLGEVLTRGSSKEESPGAPPTTSPADGQRSGEQRPRAPLQGGTGIFFRMAESADPVPEELESVGVITSQSAVAYYDYRGILQARGTMRRVTILEGVEDVETKAGRFQGCYRIRVDLSVYFPWIAIIDLSHYLWLSPEVGEVRRVQRLSGWFLIFPFESADDYRLISYTPSPVSGQIDEVPPPRWLMGAVLLEGDYPELRVGGMVVDFDVSTPAPQSPPLAPQAAQAYIRSWRGM